jgi:hypothetical protein
MTYRYVMQRCAAEGSQLDPGRPLLGPTLERALAQAAVLWISEPRRSAAGYVVVDTDDGRVVRPSGQPHAEGSAMPHRCFSAEAAGLARVTAIIDRLQFESDPEQRQLQLSSLVKEVDRFGEVARRMDLVDVYIEQAAYKTRLLDLSAPGVTDNPVRGTDRLKDLSNWREVLETLRAYRAVVAKQVGQSPRGSL